MKRRLKDKIAIVVGAGQTPGQGIGNGRAISVLFAREGAKVMLVDCNPDNAKETLSMIAQEGGQGFVYQADITKSEDCEGIAEACMAKYGRIDILVNNVGIGEDQSAPGGEMSESEWDRIFDVNLKGMYLTCKYILPAMAKQESGAVVNISSAAAVCRSNMSAYKFSKAGVNALTHETAMQMAPKGVRVNGIMLGLLNTPMAIERRVAAKTSTREEIIQSRNKLVPLKGGMGDGWDAAHAALFLASDEARYITAVVLPVDGGLLGRIGV